MIRPFIGQATARIAPTQFGATANRVTRDVIAMIDDIFRRFGVGARHSKSGKILVGVLVDLEKTVDLLPRDTIWSE
eukprot:8618786-Pyramimonas_sp.AAC.1